MGLFDLEVVKQTNDVGSHFRAVLFLIVWLIALAVSAAIKRDQLEPFRALGVEFGVAGPIPTPHAGIANPAVYEDNRFALPRRHIANLHPVGVEYLVGRWSGPKHETAGDDQCRQSRAAHNRSSHWQ